MFCVWRWRFCRHQLQLHSPLHVQKAWFVSQTLFATENDKFRLRKKIRAGGDRKTIPERELHLALHYVISVSSLKIVLQHRTADALSLLYQPEHKKVKWPSACRSASKCSHFRTRPSFWPCLAPVKFLWWYFKRLNSYRFDKQTNKQTHTHTHTHTNWHYWKQPTSLR